MMALKISTLQKLAALAAAILVLLLLWRHRGTRIRDNSPDTVVASFRIIPSEAESAKQTGGNKPRIPRIIHQIWKTHDVPFVLHEWVKKWTQINPTWEYWFWTDADMRNLIARKYPAFLDLYDSYPSPGYRADAFRYFLMYEHGGFYADLDVECLKPLDGIIIREQCILSQEPLEHAHFLSGIQPPLVSNAILACRPRHDFFYHVITELKSFAGTFQWNDILRATGPYMMTEQYRGYTLGSWFSSASQEPIRLAAPEMFMPTLDNSMLDRMRQMCLHSEGKAFLTNDFLLMQQQLCKKLTGFDFKNEPHSESYTAHHWTHLWAGKRYDPWGVFNTEMTFSILDLEKNGKA